MLDFEEDVFVDEILEKLVTFILYSMNFFNSLLASLAGEINSTENMKQQWGSKLWMHEYLKHLQTGLFICPVFKWPYHS